MLIKQPSGRFQFTLMTLFVITTAASILLAVAKIWPKQAFTVAVLTAGLAERVYRKRIKTAIGARNYEKAAWILDRLCAVVCGATLGGVLGLILSILVFGVWSPVIAGIVIGSMLGLTCPRVVLAICSLIP